MSSKTVAKIDTHLFKRLISYFKPYKGELIFAVFITISGSLVSLLPPLITKEAIDLYIVNDTLSDLDRLDGITMMIFIFLGSLLLDFMFRFYKGFITGKIGQKAIRDIRNHVFSHLQSLSLKYYDKNPIGRLMTRVTNDIEALNQMFTQGVVTIFGDIFMILGIVVALMLINFEMALWTFAVLPFLFVISYIFRLNVRRNLTEVRALVAKLNSYMQENITGMHIVKLFNREKSNFQNFKKINQDHTAAWIKNVSLYSLYFPAVELVTSFAVALIIWNASTQMQEGSASFGTIVMFIQMAQMFFRPITDLSEKYNIIQSAMAASERVFDVLDSKPDIVNTTAPKNNGAFTGEIEFKDVWFSYHPNPKSDADYVLKGVSFKVESGKKLAIVGHTGAGKSTIINLINRFYDIQKGQIYVDGIEIKDWDLYGLRHRIGMVLQDIYLFSGSIYENIHLNAAGISNDAVHDACEVVNAKRFIEQLPEQYDTKIKERGNILSTGQKQLLSFARALVFDPEILILDEATSSIDTESELLIQDAMGRMMKDRTSIIIAHRLSTIKDSDEILVMHHGKIWEKGTHNDLLEQKGLYFKLHQIQYQDQKKVSQNEVQIRDAY